MQKMQRRQMPPFFRRRNGPNNTSGDTAYIKPTAAPRAAGPPLKSGGRSSIRSLHATSLRPPRLNAVKSSSERRPSTASAVCLSPASTESPSNPDSRSDRRPARASWRDVPEQPPRRRARVGPDAPTQLSEAFLNHARRDGKRHFRVKKKNRGTSEGRTAADDYFPLLINVF